MANKICRPLTDIPEMYVEKVKVPANATYYPGNVILCETLDTVNTVNHEVYTGAAIANASTETPCIIINGGFEKLSDGRRPDGNPNPGTFSFAAGDIATAIRLVPNLKFFISTDALDVSAVAAAIGKIAIPVAAAATLKVAAAFTTATPELVGAKIERLENMSVGGNHGMAVAAGVIARIVAGT